jgi:hypothetical protein
LPEADAVVSTGRVLNYLDTCADIAHALRELVRAVRGLHSAGGGTCNAYAQAPDLDRAG